MYFRNKKCRIYAECGVSQTPIIYEIRKDVGQRKRLGKGDMLSIFINDIKKIIKIKHLYREMIYKCCNMSYTNIIMKKEVI